MQQITLGIIFMLLLSWLVIYAYLFKKWLRNMVGMVISMTLGLIVGLSVGTFSAILYPSSFFEVTITSMLIGGLIGVLTGYPFSLVAVLDGFISGIMGGLMGTMLGMMIPPENQNQILHIMSLFTVGFFFLTYLLQISEINKAYKRRTFFFHPLPYFLVVCIFIYSFHGYSLDINNSMIMDHSHSQNDEVIIHVSEYQYGKEQIQVIPNKEITLTLMNNGLEEHDFDIKELGVHLHAKPGVSNSQSIIFTEPGIYETTCALPGHKEDIMTTTIIVTQS